MIGRKSGGNDIIFLECSSVEVKLLTAGLRALQEKESLTSLFLEKHKDLITRMEPVCRHLAFIPVDVSGNADTS